MSANTTPKPFYASKMVWFNAITTLIAVLSLLPQASGLDLPPQVANYALLAVGVLNVILRVWFTTAPIEGAPTIPPGGG